MNVTTETFEVRKALLSVSLAALLVTAGCAGVLSEGPDTGTPTATGTQNDTDGGPSPADGTDLRNLTIPDNGTVTVSGELDQGDPESNGRYYEPVEVAAEAGTRVNLTMQTDGGAPALRIVNPNGTVTYSTSDGGPGTAEAELGTFSQTGRYTIEATSESPNATFEYTLTIKRVEDELFGGPMSTWNETEQYLEFGQDFVTVAKAAADNGQFSTAIGQDNIWANTTREYITVSYVMSPNLNLTQQVNIDSSLRLSYTDSDEAYRNKLANGEDYVEDGTWVPEIIFIRTYTPDGELYRTNFLTRKWARDYGRNNDSGLYMGRYLSTQRVGPAHPSYTAGANSSTTEAEFPLGTYEHYVFSDGETLAERYGW